MTVAEAARRVRSKLTTLGYLDSSGEPDDEEDPTAQHPDAS
jgi:hypothetical protein